MRRSVLLLVAAVLTLGVIGVLVLVLDPFADETSPGGEAPFATTPIEGFDTSTLTVPRAGFCADVDPREVAAALGAEPSDAHGYENGDEVALDDGLTDIVHEYGCVWSLDDGSEARAWLFAPPIDADRAQELADGAGRTTGCEVTGPASYGSPSVGLVCAGDGPARASFRGLFGDAWLACELTSSDPAVVPDELVERAGAWCVGVAKGAADGA